MQLSVRKLLVCSMLICSFTSIFIFVVNLRSICPNVFNGGPSCRSQISSQSLQSLHTTVRPEPSNGKEWVILLYTGLFYNEEWNHAPYSEIVNFTIRHNCEYKRCRVTYDKKETASADALIFHAIDLQGPTQYSASSLRKIAQETKRRHQRWIFLCHEPPLFTWNYNAYDGLFNWTMTYMTHSDIYFPYSQHREIRGKPPKEQDYFVGKTDPVLWIVSHCGLLRQEYVMELQKYIPVHVYGLCGNHYHHDKGVYRGSLRTLLSKYKFYLAFENSFCIDYITEKYWRVVADHNIVPVVMGRNFNKQNSIPGSYINIMDFKSPKHLAQHLHYLSNNVTAYNECFAWKKLYEMDDTFNLICTVCKALELHGNDAGKMINMSSFWNKTRLCSGDNNTVKKSAMQFTARKSD